MLNMLTCLITVPFHLLIHCVFEESVQYVEYWKCPREQEEPRGRDATVKLVSPLIGATSAHSFKG